MGNDFHDERDNFQKSLDFTRIRCYTCNQLHKGIGRRVDVSSLFFVGKEENAVDEEREL